MVRVLGVIPARGGSKRIPRKNLRILAGSPLISYTIRAAQEAKSLTDWIVSTEDHEIEQVAHSYGAHVLKRPDRLAQDHSSTADVLHHALTAMGRYDMVVCLHPTSLLRQAKHIDEAVALLSQSDAPSLASVVCNKRCYIHNAAIYALKVPLPDNHYSDESIPYLMDARSSIDIDEELDLKTAELYLSWH